MLVNKTLTSTNLYILIFPFCMEIKMISPFLSLNADPYLKNYQQMAKGLELMEYHSSSGKAHRELQCS